MIGEILDRIWSVWPFGRSTTSRKRNLYCDSDDEEDEYDIIEVTVTSPKRPRMDSGNDSDVRFMQQPVEPMRANWITSSARRFSESFFLKAPPKHNLVPVSCQPIVHDTITIEDDDDPEVVVVPMDSSAVDISSKSDWIKHPHISRRRSLLESRTKSKNLTEDAALSSVRKKMNVLNGSRNSSRRSTPIKQGNSSIHTGILNSNRIHEFTNRENIPRSSRGSTIEKSIRLDEQQKYAEFLNFYSNNAPHATGSVWSVSTPKQIDIGNSRKENIVTKRKSPVFKQKLDNEYSTDLKGRLHKSVLRPVQEAKGEVKWCRSSSLGSPSVKLIEREISPRDNAVKQIEVITLPASEPEEGCSDVIAISDEVMVVPSDVTVVPKEPATPLPSKNRYQLQENPLLNSVYTRESWLNSVKTSYSSKDAERQKQIDLAAAAVEKVQRQLTTEFEDKMKNVMRLQDIHILDDDVQEVEKLVELTPEMLHKVKDALRPKPPNEVLVEAFNLRITRRDMETLNRDNWLNDEVINFYFTLLAERGKFDNYPSVHVCNTFFYPKLISNGHVSLKRWTRKIDIFAHDLMLVPVHLGVHWCLAVVDFRHKKIQYYDSMSGKNQQCLNALKGYLEAESLDKKKVKLDTSDWTLETVKDKPNQLNGSDCGMFTCKYAEYISREAKITFTQEDMPYFRRRMVYEILTAKLL